MKKFILLIGIIVLSASTMDVSAQLKYQNGALSFGGTAATGASTTWHGKEHAFLFGERGFHVKLTPTSTEIVSYPGPLHITGNRYSNFQDVYANRFFVAPIRNAISPRITGGADPNPVFSQATTLILFLKPTHETGVDGQLRVGFDDRQLNDGISGFVYTPEGASQGMIDQISIIPFLVAAFQQQNAHIKNLEQRIAALENK